MSGMYILGILTLLGVVLVFLREKQNPEEFDYTSLSKSDGNDQKTISEHRKIKKLISLLSIIFLGYLLIVCPVLAGNYQKNPVADNGTPFFMQLMIADIPLCVFAGTWLVFRYQEKRGRASLNDPRCRMLLILAPLLPIFMYAVTKLH